MNILIVKHPVQELTSSTCGLFRLYFYKNIFGPEEKSKIINHETLNKRTIEAILNEVFTTDVDENEQVIEKFKEDMICNLILCKFILRNKKIKNVRSSHLYSLRQYWRNRI